MGNLAAEQATPATVNPTGRPREYLTPREVDKLMDAARSGSRYGHRDSTMILLAYRHGLTPSELCDLQWSQVDFKCRHLAGAQAHGGSADWGSARTSCSPTVTGSRRRKRGAAALRWKQPSI